MRKVITPTEVVNIPVFLDLVQPDRDIMTANEVIPKTKAIIPIFLENTKSAYSIDFGNSSLVNIEILVIANTVIKKQPEAIVVTLRMLFSSLLLESFTIRLAVIAIENPLSRELMVIS